MQLIALKFSWKWEIRWIRNRKMNEIRKISLFFHISRKIFIQNQCLSAIQINFFSIQQKTCVSFLFSKDFISISESEHLEIKHFMRFNNPSTEKNVRHEAISCQEVYRDNVMWALTSTNESHRIKKWFHSVANTPSNICYSLTIKQSCLFIRKHSNSKLYDYIQFLFVCWTLNS